MKTTVSGGFNSRNPHLLNMFERNNDGTYKRIIKPFSLENFNDGHLASKGRFFVYMPNHPRANNEGYLLRSIAAYELHHNVSVPITMSIHHIDGDRLNDSKENLVMMLFGQHISFHMEPLKKASLIPRECKQCGKIFNIHRWRLKDSKRGQFCSQKCFHIHNHGEMSKRYNRIKTICGYCGKVFEQIPSQKRRFCSNRCAAKHSWIK